MGISCLQKHLLLDDQGPVQEVGGNDGSGTKKKLDLTEICFYSVKDVNEPSLQLIDELPAVVALPDVAGVRGGVPEVHGQAQVAQEGAFRTEIIIFSIYCETCTN